MLGVVGHPDPRVPFADESMVLRAAKMVSDASGATAVVRSPKDVKKSPWEWTPPAEASPYLETLGE